MSFLLMNLFAAPAQSGSGALKQGVSSSAKQGDTPTVLTGSAEAFSAALADAKNRINLAAANPLKAPAVLNPGASQAAILPAMQSPAGAAELLNDLSLTKEQLEQTILALRAALNNGAFSGDTASEQAFEQVHEQLEQEMNVLEATGTEPTDIVDIEPVLLQVPAIAMAPQGKARNEIIARLVQLIQSTVTLNGEPANPATQKHVNQKNNSSLQNDPMLGVIQAAMFPATSQGAAAQNITAQTAESQPIISEGTSPVWMAAMHTDADVELPEVTLPKAAFQRLDSEPEQQNDDSVVKLAPSLPQIVQEAAPAEQPAHPHVVDIANAGSNTQQPRLAPLPEANAASGAAIELPDGMQAVNTQTTRGAALMLAGAGVIEADSAPQDDSTPHHLATGASTFAEAVNRADSGNTAEANQVVTAKRAHEKLLPASLPNEMHDVPEISDSTPAKGDVLPTVAQAVPNIEKQHTIQHVRPLDSHLFAHRAQVIEQVHVAIARANNAEIDRITIQLEPADLGRVDVTMDIRRDGATQLIIAADRRETLEMLQRDARGLERLLQESGVKADAGSMEFNLRQQPQQQAALMQQDQGSGHAPHGREASRTERSDQSAAAADTLPDSQLIAHATLHVEHGINVLA